MSVLVDLAWPAIGKALGLTGSLLLELLVDALLIMQGSWRKRRKLRRRLAGLEGEARAAELQRIWHEDESTVARALVLEFAAQEDGTAKLFLAALESSDWMLITAASDALRKAKVIDPAIRQRAQELADGDGVEARAAQRILDA